MNVELTPQALDDLAWLVRHETRLAKRTLQLIEDIRRNPFDGLGNARTTPWAEPARPPGQSPQHALGRARILHGPPSLLLPPSPPAQQPACSRAAS